MKTYQPKKLTPQVSQAWQAEVASWRLSERAAGLEDKSDWSDYLDPTRAWIDDARLGCADLRWCMDHGPTAPTSERDRKLIERTSLLQQRYTDLTGPFFEWTEPTDEFKPCFGVGAAVVIFSVGTIGITVMVALYCWRTSELVAAFREACAVQREAVAAWRAALAANEQASREGRSLPAPDLGPPPQAPDMAVLASGVKVEGSADVGAGGLVLGLLALGLGAWALSGSRS